MPSLTEALQGIQTKKEPETLSTALAPKAPSVAAPDFSKVEKLEKAKRDLELANAAPQAQEERIKKIGEAHSTATNAALESLRTNPEYQGSQKKIEEADQAIKDIRNLVKDNDDQATWLKAIEQISQSLIQVATAQYGLKHGVTIPGLKLEKADWNELADQSYRKLRSQIDELKETRDLAYANQKQLRSGALDLADLQAKARLTEEKTASQLPAQHLEEQARLEGVKAREAAEAQNKNVLMRAGEERQAGEQAQKVERKRQAEALKAIEKEERQARADLTSTMSIYPMLGDYRAALKKADKQKAVGDIEGKLLQMGVDPVTIKKTASFIDAVLMRKPDIAEAQLQQVIGARVKELQDKLDRLPEARQHILGGGEAAPLSQEVPAAKTTVVVRNKDGNEFYLPANQLQEALAQGYTEVK